MGSRLASTFKRLAPFVLLLLGIGAGVWLLRARSGSPSDPGSPQVRHGGELVASVRTEPGTYNRYLPTGGNAATELFTLLTQARLVRVNRATDDVEPWLAESWTEDDDRLGWTLKLRENLSFSDGVPFTSEDVLFSFALAYDPRVQSSLRAPLQVNGRPVTVAAPDARTITIRLPEPFAPGLRLLDNLPILPKHRLAAALEAGTLADAWNASKPPGDLAGLGPFVLTEHVTGQRLVFTRNPHYFRRDGRGEPLPYLDRLVLMVVPDQATEALRLEAGETDLMANGDIRPHDYARFKQLEDRGRVRLLDVGVGLDPDFLSFNLRPTRAADPRAPWLQSRALRQAISFGVDRQAIIDTVYLGAAVPIFGPVTPGNRTWHSAAAPTYPHETARARALLAEAGLRDTNADGMLEDGGGAPARFSIMTQAGHNRERVASVLQEQLRGLGLAVDLVALDPGGLFQRWSAGDYDAIYFGLQASSTDPAAGPEFWLSSGAFHFWNPRQPTPATDWEARIDALMRVQAGARDSAERHRAFAEVQRIFGEQLPSIYLVAPRITLAVSHRVLNATPALQVPQLLWSADTLASREARDPTPE